LSRDASVTRDGIVPDDRLRRSLHGLACLIASVACSPARESAQDSAVSAPPAYFVARLRVRRDTLEWDVLRSESGGWVVCNGLRFGLTAPDSLTAWRPKGASSAAARALADSIGTER
jgi:hypothetical protein